MHTLIIARVFAPPSLSNAEIGHISLIHTIACKVWWTHVVVERMFCICSLLYLLLQVELCTDSLISVAFPVPVSSFLLTIITVLLLDGQREFRAPVWLTNKMPKTENI